MQRKNMPKKWIIASLVSILFFGLLVVFTYSGKTELVFLLQSGASAKGQITFHTYGNRDQPLVREFNIKDHLVRTHKIEFPVNCRQTDSIYFDAGNHPGNPMVLHYMLIKKLGYHPVEIDLKSLIPNCHVSELYLSNVLGFRTNGFHSGFSVSITVKKWKIDWILIFVYLILSFFSVFLIFLTYSVFKNYRWDPKTCFIVLAFLIVSVLGYIMAVQAGFNASPDERDHFMAADYFKNHSVTPVEFSDSGVYTYNSLWNYSRVYAKGINYILAGKISNLFDSYFDSFISVRFFGLILIGLFALLAAKFPGQSLIVLPLLCIPQVWYVFSYVNDDYMPLFLSSLLLVVTEAYHSKLVSRKVDRKNIVPVLMLGMLLGLLFLSKRNYQLFVLFYVFYLFVFPVDFKRVQGIRSFFEQMTRNIKIPLLVLLFAVMVVFMREFSLERNQKESLPAETEQYYQQSEQNRIDHFAKGVSGQQRFGSYFTMLPEWADTSLKSFICAYGFMKYWGTPFYYRITYVLFVFLLLGFLLFLMKHPSREILFWLVVALFFFVSVVFASSWLYSYRYAFQPQGRYLFPILPLIGLLIYKIDQHSGRAYINRLFLPVSVVLFLLGIYSFVYVGIGALR